MNRRTILAAAFCALAGCGQDGLNGNGTPEAAPIESYKAGAAFDPAARHFLFQDFVMMPTMPHEDFVEEFLSRPGAGGGRLMIMPHNARRTWVEIVYESHGDVPTGPVRGEVKYHPHTDTITMPDGTTLAVRERFWQVKDRQLMTVRTEWGPAVYLIDANRRHDWMRGDKAEFEGRTAPKRELTEFETAALEKLKAGDDVAMQVTEDEMKVVGAIRARQDCLHCHKDVQVGTMLGAFTYSLLRVPAETPEKDRLHNLAGLSADERSAVATIEAAGGTVERSKGGPITGITLQKAISDSVRGGMHPQRVDAPYSRPRDAALNVLEVFPNLQSLDLSGSLVTDDGLKQIAKLKKLKNLNLLSSSVTPEGVEKLKKALPDCDVKFYETRLPVP